MTHKGELMRLLTLAMSAQRISSRIWHAVLCELQVPMTCQVAWRFCPSSASSQAVSERLLQLQFHKCERVRSRGEPAGKKQRTNTCRLVSVLYPLSPFIPNALGDATYGSKSEPNFTLKKFAHNLPFPLFEFSSLFHSQAPRQTAKAYPTPKSYHRRTSACGVLC